MPAQTQPAGHSGTSDHASGPGDDPIRQQLLQAAGEVFAEYGYSGARVAQIADRAGLTTGAIYNRFSGKSELLLEAFDDLTGALIEDLGEAELGASDLVRSMGVNLLDEDQMTSALVLESFMAARREEQVAARLRPLLAQDRDRLAKLVDRDKQAGQLAPEFDTAAVVTFCQSVALGMRMLGSIDVAMPDDDAWLSLIDRLLWSMEPRNLESEEPNQPS